MKVIDHIKNAEETLISFEILPPLKGRGIECIYKQLDVLMEHNPAFINVTYHSSEYKYKQRSDGSFDKVIYRKRPGTVGICAAIKNRYKVDVVPHLICKGFTREETENALIDLHFLGIDNVLVLRGDSPKHERFYEPTPNGNTHAIDLLKQVDSMNKGRYLEAGLANSHKTDFCIGVAGYPEKHFEAPNLDADLHFLKKKTDSGAEYVTTQMFFDNSKYFEFVERCRAAGITVPIIPGLKPLTSKKQLTVLPSLFHIDIPETLSKEVRKCTSKEAVRQAGLEWLIEQSRELKAAGVPALHFYTLGQTELINLALKGLEQPVYAGV